MANNYKLKKNFTEITMDIIQIELNGRFDKDKIDGQILAGHLNRLSSNRDEFIAEVRHDFHLSENQLQKFVNALENLLLT